MNLGARTAAWQSGLPYDEELDYIESSGTQYIELGIPYGSGYSIEAKKCALVKYVNNDDEYLLGGCGTGDSRTAYIVHYYGTLSSSYCLGPGAWSPEGEAITLGKWYGIKTRLGLGVCTRYVKHISEGESEYVLSGTYTASSTITNPYNMVLFARRWRSTTVGNISAWRTGEFIIKTSDETSTVMDLLPVLKNGVAYMYDKVSKAFLGNAGTGTLGYCKKDGTVVDPT